MLELCKAGYANKNNEDYVIEDQQRLARAVRGHRGLSKTYTFISTHVLSLQVLSLLYEL